MPAPANERIPFDAFTLAAVADELRRMLPLHVQKIQQPSPTDIILSVYGKGGAARLLISADPQAFRMHLTQIRRDNPTNPPGFCQVCRKYLDAALLTDVEMPRFDRLLRLGFRTHDGERVQIIAELMGRNANVFLVSGGDLVRGVLRPLPPGATRILRPGVVYVAPPGFDDAPDATVPRALGRFLAGEVTARAALAGTDDAAALAGLMEEMQAGRFAPHTVADAEGNTVGVWAFAPLSIPPARRFPRESISVALDTAYATVAARTDDADVRGKLTKSLDREIAFREREARSLRETLAEAERADEHERAGNNLLANLTMAKRGDTTVTVPDLYSEDADATITIEMDAKRSPQENAERLFARAGKARDAATHAELRLADRQREAFALNTLRETVADADDRALERIQAEFARIVGAARSAPAPTGDAKPARERSPFNGHRIRKALVGDYELLIGESAESNDYLTTRVAAPTDIWMHVRSAPGAHGILRTGGQPAARIPDEIIRRAAAIVAARSGTSIKHAGVVAVDVVEKRYVRKPRGAKAGQVSYERERVVDVEPSL